MKKMLLTFLALAVVSCSTPQPASAQVNASVAMDKTNSWLRSTNFIRSNWFAGTNIFLQFGTNGSVTINVATNGGGGGSGTVTSVAAASDWLTVSGSPVTTSGTLTLNAPYIPQVGSANLTNFAGVTTNEVQFTNTFRTWTNAFAGTYLPATYQPVDTQLTDLSGLSYSGNSLKYLRVNAGETGWELATVGGGGVTFDPNQFGTGGGYTNIKSGATLTNIASYQGITIYGGGQPWQVLNGDTQGDGLYFYYNGSGNALFYLGSSSIGPSDVGYQFNLGSSSLPFSTLYVTNGNFYGGITNDTLTASRLVYSDANKKLSSVTITAPLALSSGTLSIPNFVGDSGSGGTAGLVPAPGAGDSGKYLKGDGTWGTVAGSGTVTGITNAGNTSYSLINNSNAPVPKIKSLSAGSNVTLTDQGTNILVAASGGSSTGYIVFRDAKAAGSNGGSATSGAWRTHDLTEITADTTGSASLTTNTMTLPAGTYRLHGTTAFARANQCQTWITNLTAGKVELIGTVGFSSSAASDGNSPSEIMGRFTLAAPSELQLQYRVETTAATTGLGFGSSTWTTNYFSVLAFTKE